MKALVYGNGESRKDWNVNNLTRDLPHGDVMQFTEIVKLTI